MRTAFLLTLLTFNLNTFSMEEVNINIDVPGTNISIVKEYIGEPVSRRRRLTVTQTCSGKKKELYNDNFCDFSNFKLTDKNLTFTANFYNDDNGECSSSKKKDFNLKLDSNCK